MRRPNPRKVRVLDAVMTGSSMKQARRLAGYSVWSKHTFSWLLSDPAIRDLALQRVADGEGADLRPAARAALGLPEPSTAPPDIDTLVAALSEVRATYAEMRDAFKELSERIRVLLPEDVLIEKAHELGRQEWGYFGFRSLLDDLRKKYNPVNLSRLRHAVARAEHG